MKAVAFELKTANDSIVNIDKPTPSPSQVLVRVKKSALDTSPQAVVSKSMIGFFLHAKTNPLVLGWHYVGTIEAVGEDVSNFEVDDVVWGFLQYEPSQKQGAFSEYITIHEKECAHAPGNVDETVLAAAGTETITALQGLRDAGGLTKGKSVLILGAGGSVGSAAVQIAKRLEASHVTAVCSTKDVERVKGFGADTVIDRSKEDVYKYGSKFDVIFDTTPAKYSALKLGKKLNKGGGFVCTIPSMGYMLSQLFCLNGKKASFIECHANDEDLDLVGSWLLDGSVRVEIDSTYRIKDMRSALDRQGDGSKVGRVVIDVENGW